MTDIRKFKESPRSQGEDERFAYEVDTTPWGGYDSDAANVLKDQYDNDVSSTNLSGSPSVSGNVITTSVVIDLVPGIKYRLEVKWVYSGNTFEAYGWIIGEE